LKRCILILIVFTLASLYGCTYNYYPDGKGKDGKQVTVVGQPTGAYANPTTSPPVIINSPPAPNYPPPMPPQIIPIPMGGGSQSPAVVYPPNYPPSYPPNSQNK